MKKILSLVLAVLLVFSLVSLVGCGKKESGKEDIAGLLKFGMASYSYIEEAKSADADTNGVGQYATTVAAVLLDKDGKIVDAVIDTADNKVEFTSEGKAVAPAEFKTKYEQGVDYNMKAYGGAKKEWFEQADAFVAAIKGKTIDEVKALVAEDGKGKDDVVNAGCTITVTDFIKALEKAVKNAKDSDASADAKLNLGVVSSAEEVKDAAADANGIIEVATTFVASAADNAGKVVATAADVLSVSFDFDAKGVTTTDASATIETKYEKGDNYGMKAYGGAKKEWYEQADAFAKECTGKTADEISKLVAENGKGVDSLTTAGCTIYVTDLVKAAVKAAK